jgi:hypothetical protein
MKAAFLVVWGLLSDFIGALESGFRRITLILDAPTRVRIGELPNTVFEVAWRTRWC